ncbi:MAG TPA: hypothetical protein VMU24_09880 [Candidatus Acidoferrales bacterium]|nr:hypothetical protein [Candidatus Acidoferrales bacterium]
MTKDHTNSRRSFLVQAGMLSAALMAQKSAALSETGVSETAQQSAPGQMMLTIFLRHDETKTLDEINAHLDKTGFHKSFPPAGVEVVSWYVMMGIGQVVTLRFAAERLREVNLQIEHGAWGAFRTDFYPTYDYKPVWQAERGKQ